MLPAVPWGDTSKRRNSNDVQAAAHKRAAAQAGSTRAARVVSATLPPNARDGTSISPMITAGGITWRRKENMLRPPAKNATVAAANATGEDRLMLNMRIGIGASQAASHHSPRPVDT